MRNIMAILLALCLLLSMTACVNPVPSTNPTGDPVLSADCAHKDADDNDYCDHCGGFVLVELDFFAINDIHGKFQDSDSQPGVDELTTYLQSQQGNTIFLSSGDIWQGSSESNLTYGAIMVDWMNRLDFVSMTLGNHEFDWGEEYIEENARLAEFPFLAINIYDKQTDQLVSYCQPSVLVERGGLQIGIIGAIGDCYSSISADKTQDIYFKTGSELTRLVKAEATRLRQEGADVIVYSIHDGYDKNMTSQSTVASEHLSGYYDASLSQGFVDLVFEGHIHKRYVFKDEHGVYHLQGGGENSGISHAELLYDAADGEVRRVKGEFVSKDMYDDFASHTIQQELLDKYKEQIALGDMVIGQNGKFRPGDEMRQLVAQLYYEKGVQVWGAEYDIVLGGGFISIRNPWNLAAGQVKYSDLQSLFPFDNQLVLCSIKGADLQRRFFETNHDSYFIHYEDYGQSVKGNIDPKATYYIVVDSYSSSYAANRLTEVARFDANVFARDLLAEFIAQGGLED